MLIMLQLNIFIMSHLHRVGEPRVVRVKAGNDHMVSIPTFTVSGQNTPGFSSAKGSPRGMLELGELFKSEQPGPLHTTL